MRLPRYLGASFLPLPSRFVKDQNFNFILRVALASECDDGVVGLSLVGGAAGGPGGIHGRETKNLPGWVRRKTPCTFSEVETCLPRRRYRFTPTKLRNSDDNFADLSGDNMHMRRETLWKKVWASLRRVAVRILWVGPDAESDPRIEEAKKAGAAKPMPPGFLEAVKSVIELVPRKEELFTGVREQANRQMAEVWEKLWRTPRGKEYQAIKADLDRRKEKVNSLARQLEDGIYKKVLAGGRQLEYIKAHVIISPEEALKQAMAEVERLRAELEEAKAQLKQLQRAKTEQMERVNILLIEEGSRSAQTGARRRAGVGDMEQAIREAEAIDELMIEPMQEIDLGMDSFLELTQALAQMEATENDFVGLTPEVTDQPAGVES